MQSLWLPLSSVGRRFILSNIRHLSQSVDQSIVRQVNPFSNIKITSNYHLNVKPYDLLDCPDGNLLRISLKPNESIQPITPKVTEFIASFNADVQIDDQNISVDTVDNLASQVNADELVNSVVCLIEVPVKANLKVSSQRDVNIQNLYSDEIHVATNDGDITTKNLHTTNLSLTAQHGNIRCEGNTLAHKMDVRSHGEKNIYLNQILGDSLTAITENGDISTESCYAVESKFITQKGSLHLKNVHKKSELFLLDGGDIEVTGFHGVLNATTNGGNLNFQLTEIYGESRIEAKNPNKFNVNISEFVEEHTCLTVSANEIQFDQSLEHFEQYHQKNGDCDELQTGNRDVNDDLLTINTNGLLKLGKLSWMDTVKMKISSQKQGQIDTT